LSRIFEKYDFKLGFIGDAFFCGENFLEEVFPTPLSRTFKNIIIYAAEKQMYI
jgi:hypothetical protein